MIDKKTGLTEKQKLFCEYYIEDWNATKAAIRAGYSEKTAKVIGCQNLTKINVKDYIEEIQLDLEKISGLSKLKVLNEHKKIAFSTIAHLHNTWIELKEFEAISDEHKQCIKKIERKINIKSTYNPQTEEYDEYEVEFVKIELYDKLKSLDSINKMLGYDVPQKVEHAGDGGMFNIIINHPSKDKDK
jgi:phage terminase small subunit